MNLQITNPTGQTTPSGMTIRDGFGAALAALEAQSEGKPPAPPRRLPLGDIQLLPEVFSPRGAVLTELHLSEIVRALRLAPELPSLLVLWVGSSYVLVDGYHRLEAYRRFGAADVPVEVYPGSVREAVLEAGRRNGRTVLAMSNPQRQDYAWRLVKAGYTIPQITIASGISRGQVGNHRKVLRALGEGAAAFIRWRDAARAASGVVVPTFDEDERAAWLEAQGLDIAGRLGKEFGTKLATNPEIAAAGIAHYSGRKLPDLVYFLRQHLGEEDEEAAFRDDGDGDF